MVKLPPTTENVPNRADALTKTEPFPVGKVCPFSPRQSVGVSAPERRRNLDHFIRERGNLTDKKDWQYYRFVDQTTQVDCVARDYFPGDGHCIGSPDQKWMVTDSYPYGNGDQRQLFLYEFATGKAFEIGSFWADPAYPVPTRCDLHSRWSHDGKKLSFDSIHEQSRRRIYLVDVSEIIG